MTCEQGIQHLHPYVDRELDPRGESVIRAHLLDCPECRQHVAELDALRRVIRAVPAYSAPERLRARIAAQLRKQGPHRNNP